MGHPGPGRERSNLRVDERGLAGGVRSDHQAVRHPARAVSPELLRAVGDGPCRRPEYWLEGKRVLGELRNVCVVAYRGREGHVAQGREIPDSAESLGQVSKTGQAGRSASVQE